MNTASLVNATISIILLIVQLIVLKKISKLSKEVKTLATKKPAGNNFRRNDRNKRPQKNNRRNNGNTGNRSNNNRNEKEKKTIPVVDKSLRDINLKLKSAEKAQEKTRKSMVASKSESKNSSDKTQNGKQLAPKQETPEPKVESGNSYGRGAGKIKRRNLEASEAEVKPVPVATDSELSFGRK